MKITMLYAGIGVCGFGTDKVIGDRESGWIGHGVASVCASMKAAGHTVSLIDMRHLAGWTHLRRLILANPSDVYGVSVSPVDYQTALQAVINIKQVHPKCRVVVGGIHPTVFPEMYDYRVIDCVVKGEGEITINSLLADMQAGKSWPRVVQGTKPDLDEIPWADREMFDYSRELACVFSPYQEAPSITMIAGRGCAFHCSYCQPAENSVFGHPYRMRSPKNVVDEMVALHEKYHYRSVTFWDDTFTFKKSWVNEWCSEWGATGIKSNLALCSRADIICRDEGMIQRLAEVGVDCMVIGMESGCQRVLDFIKKGTTVEQNIHSAEICRKYGIKVFATYMYGLPTETNEEAMMTHAMIDEIMPEFPSPFFFIPIPGTDIYTYCKEHDLILDGVEEQGIDRTARWDRKSLKGVDYEFLKTLLTPKRRVA